MQENIHVSSVIKTLTFLSDLQATMCGDFGSLMNNGESLADNISLYHQHFISKIANVLLLFLISRIIPSYNVYNAIYSYKQFTSYDMIDIDTH